MTENREIEGYWHWFFRNIAEFHCKCVLGVLFVLSGIASFVACFLTITELERSALLPPWVLGITIPYFLWWLSYAIYRINREDFT